MRPKAENGDYFAQYLLSVPPSGADAVLWKVAVSDYLIRQGVSPENVTPATTVQNTDFAEIRRIYNRLTGNGKRRRTKGSAPKPGPFRVFHTKEEK